MNKTLLLARTMLKMQYSMAGKSSSEKFGIILVIIMVIPFGGMFFWFVDSLIGSMYEQLSATNNQNIILGLLFISMTFLLLFVSLASILSSFYFSEDIEGFMTYPFHPYQLMAGKAAAPFLSLYLTSGVLMVPILLFYGIHSEAGVLYYLAAFLIFIVFPIIPFTVMAVILMFFMRYANIAKNKDRTKLFAGLLTFVFVIGINIVLRLNQDTGQTAADITALIQEQDGFLKLITALIPTAYFSTKSLTDPFSLTGSSFLLIMYGLTFIAAVIFFSTGQKLYFKGVQGLTAGNKNRFNKAKITAAIKPQPLFISLIKKELKIIFRTPTFFMQCVAQSLFGPVFLIVILIFENSSGALGSIGTLLEQFEGKTSILILFIFSLLILGANPASYSSISRDGKSWSFNLHMPMRSTTVVYSKVVTAWLINLLSLILLAAVGIFMAKLPLVLLVIWIVLSLMASWFTSLVGTIFDLHSPKLNWTDEQEIFKARIIGLIALLLELGTFGIMVFLLWHLDTVNGIWAAALVLGGFLALVIGLCHFILHKTIHRHFQRS
ncbi:putative ABC transporter permease subunit [Thalassobacillus pellis]|uniref:putative ABC transporter permease subunit n=1 Tax=Thalassobacillus pellis TaxID=748008 RepID=UPI00196202A8|nr:ABC transporter permease [Thalassobacillus pellis]MBM7551144.1 ABC-2 type transport system permease protein [Thalassobacillus pellis]